MGGGHHPDRVIGNAPPPDQEVARGSGAAESVAADSGGGARRADATYDTATATITTGMSVMPSAPRNNVVIITDVSGRPSIAVIMAPMPIAAPATIGSPIACESSIPPAA